ncbi:MAG: hypothetical protein QMD09_12265 [Desulfatibacillaceae bacterium]|nr:hypothetical protein [Desulfatibacillaceae bacterium]
MNQPFKLGEKELKMGILSAARPGVVRQPQRLFFLGPRPFCRRIHPGGLSGGHFFLPLLLLLSIFGLLAFPAPSSAQIIDGWLVGYSFECCPQQNANRQFLVLAFVDYPLTVEARNRAVFLKYQVEGNSVYPSQDSVDKSAMRNAILGGQFARGSQMARDFQRAVGASPDGNWANSTWKALFDFFENQEQPLTLTLGERRLRIAKITKNNTSGFQRFTLSNTVENDNFSSHRIPDSVLDSFLQWEPQREPPVYPLTQESQNLISNMPAQARAALQQALSLLPQEQQAAVANAVDFHGQRAAQAAVHPLLAGSESLVNSVPGSTRQALRETFSRLDSEQQQAVASLVRTREAAAKRPLQNELAQLQDALAQTGHTGAAQPGSMEYELTGSSIKLVAAAGEHGQALEAALKKLPADGQLALAALIEARQAEIAAKSPQGESGRPSQGDDNPQDDKSSQPQTLPATAQTPGKTPPVAIVGWVILILLIFIGLLIFTYAQARQSRSIQDIESHFAPLQGRTEELLGLMKARSLYNELKPLADDIIMEAKPLREQMEALAEHIRQELAVNQKLAAQLGQQLAERIEELAGNMDRISDKAITSHMQEILNHFVALNDRILESSQKQEP